MSINTSLLFKINGLVGRNRVLDLFGLWGARYVIVAMVAWFAYAVWYQDDFFSQDPRLALLVSKAALIAWMLAWTISMIVGWIMRRPRPFITHPHIKKLFTPLTTWKSFPSDHALAAWLLVFLALIIELPSPGILILLALWVSWGRVYAGMHYPGDILGGFALAGAVVPMIRYIAQQL